MSTDLDIEVRQMLEKRRGDWPRIAAEADVSHSWISQFVRRRIDNPGFATLKRLHQCLHDAEAANSKPGAEARAA